MKRKTKGRQTEVTIKAGTTVKRIEHYVVCLGKKHLLKSEGLEQTMSKEGTNSVRHSPVVNVMSVRRPFLFH